MNGKEIFIKLLAFIMTISPVIELSSILKSLCFYLFFYFGSSIPIILLALFPILLKKINTNYIKRIASILAFFIGIIYLYIGINKFI